MDRQREKGFSLVELAIVLVVAGLILAIGAPGLRKYLESYRVSDAARQISSELRIARQKAVTNGTRNWYIAGISGNEGTYWTGIQTPLPTGGWSGVTLTTWTMPTNTKQVTPSFNGVNWIWYAPDGRAYGPSNLPASGSVKVASVSAAVHDTSQINLDLTGEVWQ